MEMIGQCHICGRPANRSCTLCGQHTCESHLKNGICSECRKGTTGGKDDEMGVRKDDVYS